MDAKAGAVIISSKIICKQPGRYIGWPTIGRTPDGTLLAVFSGDRDAHIDPFGKTMLVRSSDCGQTWGAPELINDTPLDNRDAGLCACRDGSVLVSWFTSHYTDEQYMAMCQTKEETARRQAYLQHFKKENIPLSARCLAIADAFDAMTTNRAYRKAMSVEFAADQIIQNAGTQFDPELAKAFVDLINSKEITLEKQLQTV